MSGGSYFYRPECTREVAPLHRSQPRQGRHTPHYHREERAAGTVRRFHHFAAPLLWLLILLAGLAGCQSPPRPTALPGDRGPIQDVSLEPLSRATPQPPDIHWQRGLDWLRANQQPDGEWTGTHPVACTALAMLALTGLPDDRARVARAAHWLVSQQSPENYFRSSAYPEWPYEHALAIIALSRAIEAHPEQEIWRMAAGRGVSVILAGQQTTGGWHYNYAQGTRRSTPLTSVQMQALHATMSVGLHPVLSVMVL